MYLENLLYGRRVKSRRTEEGMYVFPETDTWTRKGLVP